MIFLINLELAHKGKRKIPIEMNEVEILKETGMSLTEQRKQPAAFIELLILDIQVGRQVKNAEIERVNRRK